MTISLLPKKVPPHIKKRQAGHHRKSKHYTKTYWPYIPILLIIAAGFLVSNLWSGGGSVLGTHSDMSAQTLLLTTNDDRSQAHVPSLTMNTQLSIAAQTKAEDMVRKNYWSHISPSGATPWTFITSADYTYQDAGENLAYGFPDATAVVRGWMASPEHRANMLSSDYSQVGFGIASSENFIGSGPQTIVVAEYASPIASTANVTFQVHTNPHPPEQAGVNFDNQSTLVSRLNTLPLGSHMWVDAVVIFFSGVAMTSLLIRHGRQMKHWLQTGEALFVAHPLYDVLAVSIIVVTIVATRTSGFIR